MLTDEVFLSLLLVALVLHTHGYLNDLLAKRGITLLLALIDHHFQFTKVLSATNKVFDHAFLRRWSLIFIESNRTPIHLIVVLSDHILQ